MNSDTSQIAVRGTRERWKSWSETTSPNPSLGNLYRVSEWIVAQDAVTNSHVLAFFMILLIAICCAIASFKYFTRASTRWHVSPLAVALILLHLTSDIEFVALANGASDATFWNVLNSNISLIHPLREVRRYQGPAAYTLMILAVWETLVFLLSPVILSGQHPSSRDSTEWAFYAVTMALTSFSVVTQVDLPLIRRDRKYMSIQETFESRWSFVGTVVAFTATLLLFTASFALLLDSVLFEGCMLEALTRLLGALDLHSRETEPPESPKHKSVSIEAHEIAVPETRRVPERDIDPDIDIAAHVESYLWKQMCIVKEQTQTIEALSISYERDNLDTVYSKLSRIHTAILPVRPVLDGIIAILQPRAQRVDHFQRHLVSVDEALHRVQTQMYNLILEHNDVNFVRSAPDQEVGEYVGMLDYDAQGFVHVQLDRQQVAEELIENGDDLEILDDKLAMNDGSDPVNFSEQLQRQMAIIERHVRRLQGERSRRTESHSDRQEQSHGQRIATPPLQHVMEALAMESSPQPEARPLLFSSFGEHDIGSPPATKSIVATPKKSPRKAPSTPARPSSTVNDENVAPVRAKSPQAGVRKSADHMVVGLWNNAATLEFRSDSFLRGNSPSDLLKPDDLLSMGELGRFLILKVRGNRAETAAASKIIINLEKSARASKDNRTILNVGVNNLNYFRSCMWLGQARLTKFPPPTQDRIFTEIPIEGLIKLAGYGPDGIKSLNMLPVPKETWAQYLERLSLSADIKKVKELHEWLERYLGGVPTLLEREVPRAEGWDTGVALDANRCLYRHLENMMLLPPYPPEIEKALSIYRIEKTDEREVDPNFVGSTLVENLLSSPKSDDRASSLRFQAL